MQFTVDMMDTIESLWLYNGKIYLSMGGYYTDALLKIGDLIIPQYQTLPVLIESQTDINKINGKVYMLFRPVEITTHLTDEGITYDIDKGEDVNV